MEQAKKVLKETKIFLKWVLIALLLGVVGGLVGSAFHILVDIATETRENNDFLIWLLPLGGLAIVFLYRFAHATKGVDTNRVIEAVDADNKSIPFVMAPLIFVSTVLTHLFGGSAGREGAALQIGGSIGYKIGKLLRLDKRDMHTIVMTGMSALFAALFGTPVAATFFAIEVVSVGVMHYAGLVPCIVSAFMSSFIAKAFGLHPVRFEGIAIPDVNIKFMGKALVLAVLCALLSVVFCVSLEKCEHLFKKVFKNPYVRIFVGGCVIVALTMLLGTHDYNGAGMNVIERALSGSARWEAFVLKLLFTVITVSAGFKGGEIVPTFFIGSTFGCVVAPLIGLDPSFGAALGFIALFCSVVNSPVASVILAVEVFGGEGILFFAAVCCISYMTSGYSGLYHSQRIVYSKYSEKYINIHTR
ncbi:MAG: chloride channel protein [Ruminococcaceae bacterium]|nr:chloride channel protein [Oscillospiraceae bacterium]